MSSSARRGRPIGHTPLRAKGPGAIGRLAWLLRVNRLYGENERYSINKEFARDFHGGSARRRADASQITRWEYGDQAVNHGIIRRYEELLGLPECRLTIAADMLYRDSYPAPAQRFLTRRTLPPAERARVTMELVEKARSEAPMTGQDWERLTVCLSASHSNHIPWDVLAQRLLTEMIIADGLDWQLRDESVHRMLRNKHSEPTVLAACAALAADPENQVFFEPLTAMEVSDHPDASWYVLRTIAEPIHEHAREAGWQAAAEKLKHGHFGTADLRKLLAAAGELLTQDTPDAACDLAAAELLRTLRPGYAGLGPGMRRVIERDRLARSVYDSGRIAHDSGSRLWIRRIANAAMSWLPRDILPKDPIFHRVIDDMLLHPLVSRRLVATHLIEASPYRELVANALASELKQRDLLTDGRTAGPVLQALTSLGTPAIRPVIERICLDPALPRTVAEAAVWSLGHARGQSSGTFWLQAIARYRNLGPDSPEYAMRGLVYAAGIGRETVLLHGIRRDTTLPRTARTAAAWWLNRPASALASTTRTP